MDNQHRLIKGYAELDKDAIELVNEISEMGFKLEELLDKVNARTKAQRSAIAAVHKRIADDPPQSSGEQMGAGVMAHQAVEKSKAMDYAQPERFAAMARTELQTGLMYLRRAVGQPQIF